MGNDIAQQIQPVDAASPSLPDAVLHECENTRVWRGGSSGAARYVVKQPLGPTAGERLRHERHILKRLETVAGVARLSDAARLEDALVLEDCGGATLAQCLRDGPPALHALLALAGALARIVADMHRQGVVHKDINPANIVVGAGLRPVLIDFDLASTFSDELPSFAHHSAVVGTLAYLAPEQTGRTGRSVDQRADLYALGATLYQMATGRLPFRHADPMELLHAHLAQPPEAPIALAPHLPRVLSDIILRLLEKEPDRRYQSADGLLHDLARLQRQGCGDPFRLGANDFPARLAAPSRLTGREREVGMLRSAFETALTTRRRGIFVTGDPGVGKTALINELRPVATAHRGWFISGKSDQYHADASPACLQALRALGRLLLAEPGSIVAQHRERIVRTLGASAGLITSVSPELAILLGPQATAPESTAEPDAQQLPLAMRNLLRAVVSPARPLVVVLDDLQWADEASMRFIDLLLCDEALRGLCIVGAYRHVDVPATHPLGAALQRWERFALVPAVHLPNLPSADLAAMLADMLRLRADQAAALAEVVGAHTGGNPYDTVELVNALRREKALVLTAQGWAWDAGTVRRYVGAGSVVDMLAGRIARLPQPARHLLAIMACLGGEVSHEVLQAAGALPAPVVEEALSFALEEGLLAIEQGAPGQARSRIVRFRHDRVQQAVHENLQDARALHGMLARRFAALPGCELEAAAQYLEAGPPCEPGEGPRIALLFRQAGAHARRIADHRLAERYATAALDLLARHGAPAGLVLELEQDRHAALYQLGRLAQADAAFRSIDAPGRDPLAIVEATCIQISSLTNRSREAEALALGFAHLRKLGVDVPDDFGAVPDGDFDTFFAWARSLDLYADLARPDVVAVEQLAIGRLVNQLMNPAMFVNWAAMAWLVLQGQRQWAAHGPNPKLVFCLANAGRVTVGMRQDYRTGYQVTRYLLDIAEGRRYQVEACHARFMFATYGAPWCDALDNNMALLLDAREGLLRGGDIQVVSYTHYVAMKVLLETAPTLDHAAAEIRTAFAFADSTGNDRATGVYAPYAALLRALRGDSADPPLAERGPPLQDDAPGAIGNPFAHATHHLCRALGAALLGAPDSLAFHADQAKRMLPVVENLYAAALARLLLALSLAQRLQAAGPAKPPGLLGELDQCRDWLRARAADAPANFQHLSSWIDAEQAWATGEPWQAARLFDAACHAAETARRPWHRALIVERAGMFSLDNGLPSAGYRLLGEARHLYAAWGAVAKVRQLDGRIGHRLSATGARGSQDGSSRSGALSADAIDLLAILRASQALSSETSLDALCERVVRLIGTMTGATAVRLALRTDTEPRWQLFVPAGAGEPCLVAMDEAGMGERLPMSAFQYVERTAAPLLVTDALADDRFARDPCVAGLEQCSLLVVPILRQGTLSAIVSMENRLSHGAFTTARLDAVTLIAGQLAVSLENAALYSSLERKVGERTAALEEANRQLAAQAITDPLTGLANRRHFTQVLEAEWQRASRAHGPLAAIMVDIDQFKLYNDHLGHLQGDACLRLVAATLAKSFRIGTDLVARYGGEEFAVILPGTDRAAAILAAERARAAIEALREPHGHALHGIVTISLGIASAMPGDGAGMLQLLAAADGALYAAKHGGRNRVQASAG